MQILAYILIITVLVSAAFAQPPPPPLVPIVPFTEFERNLTVTETVTEPLTEVSSPVETLPGVQVAPLETPAPAPAPANMITIVLAFAIPVILLGIISWFGLRNARRKA